jgi:segregation and condensation protein B
MSDDANSKPPLSADRLRQAFSQMAGKPVVEKSDPSPASIPNNASSLAAGEEDSRGVNPRSIVEAMLFVGQPDARPLSAREMAARMRGVSPNEVDMAVEALNHIYEEASAAYEISHVAEGYQLALHREFERIRDKFYGRTQEAKLSTATIEVLSIVAYHQPLTLQKINELRRASSGGLLASLVRRELVAITRVEDRPRLPDYVTTERFLRLFHLRNLEDLPQNKELSTA